MLRVKGWSEFQHYSDRRPPWIKLHRELLENYYWFRLSSDSRSLAICIWLLACEYDDPKAGLVTDDPDELAFRSRMDSKLVIQCVKELIKHGFVEHTPDEDDGLLAPCYQCATPEAEAEAEAENNNHAVRDLPSTLLMPDGRFLSPDQFCQEMWQAYPSVGRRKGHMGKFTEQIKKALKGGESHEAIIAGVTAYAKYCNTTGQLNKDAERWARDAEWRGDYQIGSPAHRPQQGGQSRQSSGGLAQVIDAGEKAKEMLRRADEA
jgi:DNA-binding MarR family transcriptional regulator